MNKGTVYAILAFVTWGFFPLYFHFVIHLDPFVVTAHRVTWAFLILFIPLGFKKETWVLAKNNWKKFSVPAVMIGLNWFIFVYAVHSKQVTQASLGYFLGPLISVLLGVVLFKEKISRLTLVSLLFIVVAIFKDLLTIGEIPILAVSLGFTFAYYGALKKTSLLSTFDGLFMETLFILPIALFILVAIPASLTWTDIVLLIFGGFLTLLPLYFFSKASQLIKLSQLAFIQYFAPSLHFCFAIFFFKEPLNQSKIISFSLVWFACLIYVYDSVRKSQSNS